MTIQKNAMTVVERFTAVGDLARLTKTELGEDCTLWATGRYIILQYELLNVGIDGKQLDRSKPYKILENVQAVYLGGSAYAVPVGADETAELRAVMVWNSLQTLTQGLLLAGDIISIHYAGNNGDLGVVAQCVPSGKTSMRAMPIPEKNS